MLRSMLMFFPARRNAALVTAIGCGLLAGCANPGPPKPPSLQIPAAPAKISAERRGDVVTVDFALPERTTDGVALRPGSIKAALCRAVSSGVCVPLPGSTSFAVPAAAKTTVKLRDSLPQKLASGPPSLLTYRVELSNQQGRTSGFSEPAFAAAGAAPERVTGLAAQGSRHGVVLTWRPLPGDNSQLLLRREDLAFHPASHAAATRPHDSAKRTQTLLQTDKKKTQPQFVVLDAAGEDHAAKKTSMPETLDTTAEPEHPYRYIAERRLTQTIAGHALELWSEPADPIVFTLHDTFPPPVPKDLSVAGFLEAEKPGETSHFAVDLIWDPVQDEQLDGYKVYRQVVGDRTSEKILLTKAALKLPAFHDITASASGRYRYSVTSIDLKGNESDAVTAVLEPQP